MNHQLVLQISNVHQDLHVTTSSANLFVTVTPIVSPTSSVTKTYVKKFAEKMVTVTPTKFVKEYNVSKVAEEIVIALPSNLVKTTNALVIIISGSIFCLLSHVFLD